MKMQQRVCDISALGSLLDTWCPDLGRFFRCPLPNTYQLLGWHLVVKNLPANAWDMRCGFSPWVGKIPWRRAWQPTPVFIPGWMGRGAWRTIVHRVAQSWTQLKGLSTLTASTYQNSTTLFEGSKNSIVNTNKSRHNELLLSVRK